MTQSIKKPKKNASDGVCFEKDNEKWTVYASTQSPYAFFYLPFMILWTVLLTTSHFGTEMLRGNLSLSTVLLLTPFILITVLYWWITLLLMTGHYLFSVNDTMGSIFIGIGTIGWTRTFNWHDIHTITECDNWINRPQLGFGHKKIRMEADKSLTFAILLSQNKRHHFLEILRNQLIHRKAHTPTPSLLTQNAPPPAGNASGTSPTQQSKTP